MSETEKFSLAFHRPLRAGFCSLVITLYLKYFIIMSIIYLIRSHLFCDETKVERDENNEIYYFIFREIMKFSLNSLDVFNSNEEDPRSSIKHNNNNNGLLE
jgi:hypothetical protein